MWTVIREAGANDRLALERFAADYRGAVLGYVRSRGHDAGRAEDLCHDVFVRLLSGNVLAKADAARGRFRSLLLCVARRVLQDDLRKRRPEVTVEELEVVERDPDFDRAWVVHLAERAIERMREEGSPYHAVLTRHLAGDAQDRNKLWIARTKLVSLIRHEIALTCRSHEEFEEEVAYLSQFLARGAPPASPSPPRQPSPPKQPSRPEQPSPPKQSSPPAPSKQPKPPKPPHSRKRP